MTTKEILIAAKNAKAAVSMYTTKKKNDALNFAAEELLLSEKEILAANRKDLDAAKGKISDVMLDRLMLNHDRISGMAEGVRNVASLEDPNGKILSSVERDGLKIDKVATPIGVIAIIYESRPNVTSDAAALTLKSGNVCVLRCGKEAHSTSEAIISAMRRGLKKAGVVESAINLIEDTSRTSSEEIMSAVGYVDLLIPRGGAGLIKSCVENSKVPCIQTGSGICHVYVDKDADFDMALDIVENAKCSRPSVCNAAEVCLVHAEIAERFLPLLWDRLYAKRTTGKVEIRADEKAYFLLKTYDGVVLAGKKDFDTEFLDYILAVKVVSSVEEATAHILEHSTGHSEAIVTKSRDTAAYFTGVLDSAVIYVNASTRFTDGGVFGLGCEIGISTQKIHARGPMGLSEIMSYKYVVEGNGAVRR
ncbi:MAG: glutamate-5-semialdehyde dehydrogenase [Clostridia bacterium]|nr:glutamate-5-semialdehyde dehydrogenase [Clostridia bacterium]